MNEAEHLIKDSPEYRGLESRINTMNLFAWIAVVSGAFAMAIGAGLLLFGRHDELPRIGDYSGGMVASLWSLAGILFVYTAFLGQQQQMMLQEEELKLSRAELKATRAELLGQKEALEAQVKTAESQRFENTFFALLEGLLTNINSLRLAEYTDEPSKTGFGIYSYLVTKFRKECVSAERYAVITDRSRKGPSYEHIEGSGTDQRTLIYSVDEVEKAIYSSLYYLKKLYGTFEHSGDPIAIARETIVLIDFVEKQKSLSIQEKAFYHKIVYSKLTNNYLTYLIYHVFRYGDMKDLSKIIENLSGSIETPASNLLIQYHHLKLFSYRLKEELEEEE